MRESDDPQSFDVGMTSFVLSLVIKLTLSVCLCVVVGFYRGECCLDVHTQVHGHGAYGMGVPVSEGNIVLVTQFNT